MFTKGSVFYTFWILLFFSLKYKNVCFYFYVLCNVAFFSSFLNMKQINIKIKIYEILPTNYFMIVKSNSSGGGKPSVKFTLQVGGFQPWRMPWTVIQQLHHRESQAQKTDIKNHFVCTILYKIESSSTVNHSRHNFLSTLWQSHTWLLYCCFSSSIAMC